MSIYVGIDYSYTTPSMCIFEGNNFSFEKCKIYFITDTKKYVGEFGNIIGIEYPDFDINEERFNNISDIFLSIIKKYKNPTIGLESYSYGSKGKVFHIAENTGLLKHKLWTNNINFDVYAPTAIKKFATGKGNANKDKMYEYFIEENKSIDILSILRYNKTSIDSPIGDIVDSYYICKYHYVQRN